MKKFLLMGLMSVGLVACGRSPESFEPQIRGEILTLSQTGNAAGIYVEGEELNDSSVTAASVTITKDTTLLNENGKSIKFDDLEEGTSVEIEFEGEIAESYPVQGTAKTIRVVTVEVNDSESAEETPTEEATEASK